MKNQQMRRISFLVVALWLVGGTASSRAQDEQNESSSSTTEEATTVQSDSPSRSAIDEPHRAEDAQAAADAPALTASSASSAASTTGLVSVDFKDADMRQVLRILSLKSGVDIVAGADVEGLVTIKLTNVPWEQALDVILRTYGFTYERKGNIIRVTTIEALEKEALSTEVFTLDYAKAKDVPDVIKEMLSERGRVNFDERTNTVIVTDIPTSLFQIKQVVGRLDSRTPQVLIETKVVETRLTKDERLGIDWSDSLTLSASAVSLPTTFPFPGGSQLGSLGQTFIPRAGTFSPSTGASLPEGRVPAVGGQVTFGTLSSTGLSVVLNFLKSRTDTHILSNPSISALNNQEAKIHIGSEFPVPNYTLDPTTARTTISGYTAKSIGTILTVTPHVNPSSEIVVELKPEVTTFAGNRSYDTGTGTSIALPEFTVQSAKTQVRIQNSETVAIGGLVKQNETKTEVKVPLLGDLPLIGLLFKNTTRYGSSDPVRQDLLILLTVKLMDEPHSGGKTVAVAPPSPAYP